jgi:hypothetical protein
MGIHYRSLAPKFPYRLADPYGLCSQ